MTPAAMPATAMVVVITKVSVLRTSINIVNIYLKCADT